MLPELPGEELKRSKLKNKRKGGIHPNAWTLEGVIDVSFSQLGMTSQRTRTRIHMGQTRRVSDALFAVSQAYTQHTSVASLELKRSICAARIDCIWFLLEDAHDCTPVKVNFGNLRRDLAPHARYWHKEKIEGCADVQWRLLSAEDFRTVSRKEFPPSGIVELLAHLQRISWPKETRGFMGVESKRARLRPCYLQRGNGSTIYAALARDHTFITFEDLCSMAHEIPFVFWNVNSDLASSCQRGKMEKARQARMHNDRALEPESTIGVIMFISGECVGHIFHREIEKEFETQRLIPRLYDAAWCVTLPGMYSSMVQAFDRIVSGDWEFGFFPHVQPPDPAWERHRKALVDLTLRRSLLTRAEQEDDHLTGSLESLADEWQDFFNGDPRQPFLSHFCFKPGCCGGQDKEVSKARCRRLLQYALLFGVGKSLPSTTRWYTFSPHLASQALGLFTNKVYTRAQEMTHQARIELPTSQTHAHSLRHACQRTHITYHISHIAAFNASSGSGHFRRERLPRSVQQKEGAGYGSLCEPPSTRRNTRIVIVDYIPVGPPQLQVAVLGLCWRLHAGAHEFSALWVPPKMLANLLGAREHLVRIASCDFSASLGVASRSFGSHPFCFSGSRLRKNCGCGSCSMVSTSPIFRVSLVPPFCSSLTGALAKSDVE